MAYTPYATVEDYEALGLQDFDGVEAYLLQASRHIDTLTFNRIVAIGFDNLTDFQKEIIKEVTCKQALFEYENDDEINSVISGYTINQVTVRYGDGIGAMQQSGITIPKTLYSFLEQTGLCCRLAREVWRSTQN